MECLYRPEIRGKPVAVCGDTELRHGIVLAKNYQAKAKGVGTGEAIWQAKQKCPDIIIIPPNYERYLEFSRLARKIYSRYSPNIESFGLDECWIDLTGTEAIFGNGEKIADEIRERIKKEMGVTASVGVSFNKVFAKLGSDMKKPDATTVISSGAYQKIVWPLEVGRLLFVGSATRRKLHRRMIYTIGDLANYDVRELERIFGKNGRMLWAFANGLDSSPVMENDAAPPVKSIGNSTTAPKDLTTDQEVKITIMVLAESVAERLRDSRLKCTTVQLYIRDRELHSYERQSKLDIPVSAASVIYEKAFALYKKHHEAGRPIRSIGVRACGLVPEKSFWQLSFFGEDYEKQEELERTIDDIRRRFGHFSVCRGIMLCDKPLSALDPKGEHVIYPQPFQK